MLHTSPARCAINDSYGCQRQLWQIGVIDWYSPHSPWNKNPSSEIVRQLPLPLEGVSQLKKTEFKDFLSFRARPGIQRCRRAQKARIERKWNFLHEVSYENVFNHAIAWLDAGSNPAWRKENNLFLQLRHSLLVGEVRRGGMISATYTLTPALSHRGRGGCRTASQGSFSINANAETRMSQKFMIEVSLVDNPDVKVVFTLRVQSVSSISAITVSVVKSDSSPLTAIRKSILNKLHSVNRLYFSDLLPICPPRSSLLWKTAKGGSAEN